jgi:hypothetical protein
MKYGPQTAEVEKLLLTIDLLDFDRIAEIAAAYREHGRPHARFVWAAAKVAGRSKEVAEAAHAMSQQVQMCGITYPGDPNDVRLVGWAGNNAALAIATEDLIGRTAYSIQEYAQLVDPWFAGFADQPLTDGKETE